MEVRSLDGPGLLRGIRQQLRDDTLRKLYVGVAFATWGGLSQIWQELSGAVARGSAGTFVIGVGNGVSTEEAVSALLTLEVDVVGVNTANPTAIFHPKVYEFWRSGTPRRALFLGSSNLTTPGLLLNDEANVYVEDGPVIGRSLVRALLNGEHPLSPFAETIDDEWLERNRGVLIPESVGRQRRRIAARPGQSRASYRPVARARTVAHPIQPAGGFRPEPEGDILLLQLTSWDAEHGEIVLPMGALGFFSVTGRRSSQNREIQVFLPAHGTSEVLSLDWRDDSGNYRLSSRTVRAMGRGGDLVAIQRHARGEPWVFELVRTGNARHRTLLAACDRAAAGARGKRWGIAIAETA